MDLIEAFKLIADTPEGIDEIKAMHRLVSNIIITPTAIPGIGGDCGVVLRINQKSGCVHHQTSSVKLFEH